MQLFSPSSKVQRDRNILRESDARLAKYSRRGILFSLIAYTICLSYGYLRVMEPQLAVSLTVGFFIVCITRAFFFCALSLSTQKAHSAGETSILLLPYSAQSGGALFSLPSL